MIKNVASQTVDFLMLSTADGSAVITGTPIIYYKGDGGTQTVGTGTASHKGNGEWEYIPAQAETNYDHVVFLMVLTGAFSQAVNIYPYAGDVYTAVTALDTIVNAIQAVTDKIDTSMELDGTEYRFTVNALEEAPTSTGGDATAASQTTIIDHLTDIKGATFVGSTDSLEAIRDQGDTAWLTGAGGSSPTVEEIRAEIDTHSTQLGDLTARLTADRAGYLDKLNVTGTLANSDTSALYQSSLTTIDIADAVWDELLSGHVISGSSGNALATASSGGVDPAVLADAIWDEAISEHTTAGTFGAKNQNLVPSETIEDYQGSTSDATEANQTTIIGHLTAIKGATFSEGTDSLEAIRDQGDTAWITGSGSTAPTAEEIRTEIDTYSSKLSSIATDVAGLGGEAMRGTDSAYTGTVPTVSDIVTEFDNSSTQLALLVSRLSAVRAGYLDKLNVTGTLAHSDTAIDYKADVSGLATAVALATVDTVVDSIKTKTDNIPVTPAEQTAIETVITNAHATTDSILSSILADTGTDIPALINALNIPNTADTASAILDSVLTDLTDNSLNSGQTITLGKAVRAVFNRFFREVTQSVDTQTVKNDSGEQVTVMTVSDSGILQTKGIAS